jgi:redox-sensitive bicupin YhaK (pirin superfamily)
VGVKRIAPLGAPPWPASDPFLFCMHHVDGYPPGDERLAPSVSLAGRNLGEDFSGKDGWSMYHGELVPGFPQHPHRGFETVTIARRGFIDHSDSLGAAARYGEGDVQWLTAGRGIVHAEMFPLLDRNAANPLELFQIWLNLKRSDKLAEPHFAMLWGEAIPVHTEPGVRVTLVAGALGDERPPPPPPHSWAARTESLVAIWTLALEPGATWTLPPAGKTALRTLYFFQGASLHAAGRLVPGRSVVELEPEADVRLDNGSEPAELLLLQGAPIAEPVVQYGPFVMSSRAEIQQAFADYQATGFGGWPWPSHGPVQGREEGRFARHPGGQIERPPPRNR